jgi:hypothetical protein
VTHNPTADAVVVEDVEAGKGAEDVIDGESFGADGTLFLVT